MRVCVYTAIYGDYDSLKQPEPQSIDCDFLCFTDAPWPSRIGAWRVVRSGFLPDGHPRLRAKYFKCMSHKIFPHGRLAWRFAPFSARPAYDYLIWVDGSLRLKSRDFAASFTAHVRQNGLAMFVHPDRDCIYDELEAARFMRKYLGLPLAEQVESYRREGFPAHQGLMANGVIARKVGHAIHPTLNAAWWAEILRWTIQDQLSLPVVLRRLNHD